MSLTNDNLAKQLRDIDTATQPCAMAPLNAKCLLEQANRRRHMRRAVRNLGTAGAMALACFAAMHLTNGQHESQPSADIAQLVNEVKMLSTETNALLADMETEALVGDALISAKHIAAQAELEKRIVSQLQAELVELEARITIDSRLALAVEWSRSGALRLELAHQDARYDPEFAAAKYRQIASTYAETCWGSEATLALADNSPY